MANLTDKFIDFMNPAKDDVETVKISILERFKPVARGAMYGAVLGALQLSIIEAAEFLEYKPSSFVNDHFIAKWAFVGAVADHIQYVTRRIRHVCKKIKEENDDHKTNYFS